MCDDGRCVYGTCSAETSACVCARAFFTRTVDAPAGDANFTADLCAESIGDVYPVWWTVVRVVFALLNFVAAAFAAVYLYRLRRQRLFAGRRTFRGQAGSGGTCQSSCSLRTRVFGLLLAASSTRAIWLSLDPRGASFVLHEKMTSREFPTHEERFNNLLLVRFLDYILLSISYVCMFSMIFAVTEFWVQVSLQFTDGGASRIRRWNIFFEGVQVMAWCSFLGISIVLVGTDSPSLVLLYNAQAMIYGIIMWAGVAVAYKTVYQATMSKLTLLALTQGTSTKEKDARKRHARQQRNLRQITRLAFGTMGIITLAFFSLLVATAVNWTSRPLPYFIVVGVLYRAMEVLFMGTFLHILRVRTKDKKRRRKKAKKKMTKGSSETTGVPSNMSDSTESRGEQNPPNSGSALNAVEQIEIELLIQARKSSADGQK